MDSSTRISLNLRDNTHLPVGSLKDNLLLYEPYYKVRQDMSEGIRVEQPMEMIPWRDVPKSLDSWKRLGNEYFSVLNTANEGQGALACYERAIQEVKADVAIIAVLLNNMATCRFKMGGFRTAAQLAGAAVHLDPTYVKGWFRFASALAEVPEAQKVAERVVAHALKTIPKMATKERRLLEGTIKTDPTTGTESSFKSYVQWCAELESPGFLLVTKDIIDGSKDVDTWRKLGSDFFVKSDYQAAEECYRKGMAASASCCRDVALVLNNVAAVHLMLHHEASDVPGISVGGSASDKSDHVPSTEAALLNCTVAGIIDPLNHKTWTRRARCLEKLGFKQEECIHDLNAVRASVVSKAFASAESRERVQAFKSNMSAEVERRSQISESKPAKVSDISTDTQRKERDALQPESIAAMALNNKSKAEESIDEYIARMESFEQMVRFGFAASKSKRQIKSIPREWKMFLEHPPPQIHVEFPKLRGWPEGIDPTFAQKILHRAYLDASANPWIFADTMRQGAFYEHMDPSELVKRWHGTEALEVLQSKGKFLKYGDIIDGRTSQSDALPAYDARIRSNFVNNPNRAEVYFFGSTHVAMGFNDLSSLLSAKIQDKTSSSTGPLRFEGIEMSEFAVAKCKVVAQMLGSPDVSIASVMEVWLSSTWSETTLAAFRKSLDTVLAAMKGTHENPKVVSYLKHWASTETISAAKARSEFFLNIERYNVKTLMAPASFCRQIDRLDLIQYILTGEVRVSSNASNVLEKEQTGYVATNSKRKSGSKKPNRRKTPSKKLNFLLVVSRCGMYRPALHLWRRTSHSTRWIS
ncbi:hypothetical protein L916_02837 [Phytophthora nicotianae]|uniref:Uncharacterized protein n=1 Tax=Phytophthora nicotianae TaxID=4792 RepID=W2JNV4_PHYNI|nr:hypothetical protein L916_02837 [Phytophthora nicotianae]